MHRYYISSLSSISPPLPELVIISSLSNAMTSSDGLSNIFYSHLYLSYVLPIFSFIATSSSENNSTTSVIPRLIRPSLVQLKIPLSYNITILFP